MGTDEHSQAELTDAINTLLSNLGCEETIELLNAISASQAYFNDFSLLDQGPALSLDQHYVEKVLYIAFVLDTVLRAGDTASRTLLDVFPFCPKHCVTGPNVDILTPVPQEKFIAILNKILADDYQTPGDVISLVEDIHCIGFAYLCGAGGSCISSDVSYKLDLATFRLLFALGQIQGQWKDYPSKVRQRVKTKAGKQNQGSQTKGMVLSAYKSIGAEWNVDGCQKRPVLLKGLRISINKLAGEIFIRMRGAVTQRHINNCLKELHEKGEI